MSVFTDIFIRALRDNGLERYAAAADQFEELAHLLRRANDIYNLTALTDYESVAYRHFADCLYSADRFPGCAQVLDVGCGGGFPTLPLAIVRPDLQITAMDSTAKKLGFVRAAAAELGLSNVTTLYARAEEAGRSRLRESYDAVCARAVARLPVLLEWCTPLVKPEGVFFALKGKNGASEVRECARALAALCCTAKHEEYALMAPQDDGTLTAQGRCIVTVRKNAPTPQEYPRAGARIKKKPL